MSFLNIETNLVDQNKIETINDSEYYHKCKRYIFNYINSQETHSEYNLTFKENCVIDVLIIGGGGGGGYNCGGGGGGGEVIHHQNYIPELNKNYVIKVGKGGLGATYIADTNKDPLKQYYGNNGENSSFGNEGDSYDYSMAKGGGGGAGLDINIYNIKNKNIYNKDFSGEDGGSGGGSYAFQYYYNSEDNYIYAKTNKNIDPNTEDTYTINTYGNDSSYSKNLSIHSESTVYDIKALGGGGGGAGTNGENSIINTEGNLQGNNNGNGGDGIQLDNCPMEASIKRDCDIDNINQYVSDVNTKYWAAGGGGGSLNIYNGIGGNNIGGDGGNGMDSDGENGQEDTGSGGGGAGWGSGAKGGNGANGIVIVLVRINYDIKIPKLIKDYDNYNAIFKNNLDTFLKKHYMYDDIIKINKNYVNNILNLEINKDNFVFYNANGVENIINNTNIKKYDILFNLIKGLINSRENIDKIKNIIIDNSVSCRNNIFCFNQSDNTFKLKYDVNIDINLDNLDREFALFSSTYDSDDLIISIKQYIKLLLINGIIDKKKLIVLWVYISNIYILSEFRKNAEKILLNLLYLKWKDVDSIPSGSEIINENLKNELQKKKEFTKIEFESFIQNDITITHDSWIKIVEKYYKPVNICEEISNNIDRYYEYYSNSDIISYVDYDLDSIQSIQTNGYQLEILIVSDNIIRITHQDDIDTLSKINESSLKNKFKIKNTDDNKEYGITYIIKNSDNYEITLDDVPTSGNSLKIVPKELKLDNETYNEKRQNLNHINKNIKNNKYELEKINNIYIKYKKQFDLLNIKSNIYYFIIGIISILVIVLFAFNINNEIKSILLIIGIVILLILYIYNYFTSFSKDIIEQFNSDSNNDDKYDKIDYKCLYNQFTENNHDNGCRKDASICNSDVTQVTDGTCETRLKLIYIIRNNLFNNINKRWIDINNYIDNIDKKYIYDKWIDMENVINKEEQTYKNYNEFYNLKKKKNKNINNIYINKIFFQSNFINMILMIYLIIFILLLFINLFPDNIRIILFLGIILLSINIYIYVIKVKQPTRNNIIYKYWNKPSLN